MRITRIELKEIGPFDDAVLSIPAPPEGQRGELVIFEGPNGSGKTTIAQTIACVAGFDADLRELIEPLGAPTLELQTRMRVPFYETRTRVAVDDLGASCELQFVRGAPMSGRAGAEIAALRQMAGSLGRQSIAWAAFAYRGHQPTADITTRGPTEIGAAPLRGALSFGAVDPASAHFGQLLVNLDYEVAKAMQELHRNGISSERKDEVARIAASRQAMLDGIARALSSVLARTVTIDISLGEHTPKILLDGEDIPLALLGEGMRSTFAWLSDLLVRLHRIRWEDHDRSPLEQDFWLILDEIDESLHPTMQMRILPALRALFPNARIYLTTHSPFVVASAGEGYVFSIRPDEKHHVRGEITGRKLEHGLSLEWVVEEVFGAETGILDTWARDALRAHRADVARLRRKEAFGDEDWSAFLARRDALMRLNEQVQTAVAMQEVPVARVIDARAREAAA